LIPHANKILLRIIQGSLATCNERELSEEQAEFRKGRGMTDQIANIRWVLERAMEYGKTIFMGFIFYSKTFNCVEITHQKLCEPQDRRVTAEDNDIENIYGAMHKNRESSPKTFYPQKQKWLTMVTAYARGMYNILIALYIAF